MGNWGAQRIPAKINKGQTTSYCSTDIFKYLLSYLAASSLLSQVARAPSAIYAAFVEAAQVSIPVKLPYRYKANSFSVALSTIGKGHSFAQLYFGIQSLFRFLSQLPFRYQIKMQLFQVQLMEIGTQKQPAQIQGQNPLIQQFKQFTQMGIGSLPFILKEQINSGGVYPYPAEAPVSNSIDRVQASVAKTKDSGARA